MYTSFIFNLLCPNSLNTCVPQLQHQHSTHWQGSLTSVSYTPESKIVACYSPPSSSSLINPMHLACKWHTPDRAIRTILTRLSFGGCDLHLWLANAIPSHLPSPSSTSLCPSASPFPLPHMFKHVPMREHAGWTNVGQRLCCMQWWGTYVHHFLIFSLNLRAYSPHSITCNNTTWTQEYSLWAF